MKPVPQEILTHIFSFLPVVDARNFTTTSQHDQKFSRLTRRSYKDRTSLWQYLTPYFPDVKMTLALMWFCDACIMGSRAVEFFVPGSCDVNSDFDLFVCRVSCRNALSKGLEQMGFKFETIYSRFEDDVMKSGKEMYITYQEFIELMNYLNKLPKTSVTWKTVEEHMSRMNIFLFNRELFPRILKVKDEKLCSWKTEEKLLSYGHLEFLDVKTAHLRHKGQNVRLQIIYSPKFKETYRAPFEFHSSLTQCFISPVVAVHFYGEMCAQKRSYRWNNLNPTPKCEEEHRKCIYKFERRGYTYSKEAEILEDPSNMRHAKDDKCTIVKMPSYIYIPIKYKELYMNKIYSIRWYEFSTMVHLLEDPFDVHIVGDKRTSKRIKDYNNYKRAILDTFDVDTDT